MITQMAIIILFTKLSNIYFFCLIFLIANTSNLLNAVISLDANKALIFAKSYQNITLGCIPQKLFIPSAELQTFAGKVKFSFNIWIVL